MEVVETQEFTEADVAQLHEKVRELAQEHFTKEDEKEEVDSDDESSLPNQSWLGRLDSELQGISGLQERGSRLQEALKELLEKVEDLRARSVEPAAEQVEALTLLRDASEVLRKRWPEDEPPKEWKGVTFREGQVSELDLSYSALTTLPAEVGGLRALTSLHLLMCRGLTTLPAEVGGLRALTSLDLRACDALTSLPKELHLDVVAAKDWLHGQHLVAQHSAKQWDGDEMLRCLRDRPGVLHALAEQPAAVDLLRAVLEADPSLADVTEGEKLSRTPIQHACPACGIAMRAALCLLGRFEIDDGPPLHFSATSAVVQADDLGGAGETSGADAKPPRCALKAMRKTEQVLAELNGRNGLDRRYVVAVLAVYVDESADKEELQQIVAAAERLGVPVESALNLERRLSLELAQRIQNVENVEKVDGSGAGIALQRRPSSMQVITTPATAAQEPQAARAAGYSFLIVLALADRNLNTALTHDHVAGNDFPQIRMIMSHLAHALDNLHSEERIHADFKPLNAARELTWKLIDMDVSRKFGESFGTKLPSSGYCPPEVAKVLLAATDAKTGKVDTNELAKYTASVAYDLWSFGVVLFHLCYGISLFNTDQNDNVRIDDLQTLAAAPEGLWRKLIKKALSPGERRNASVDLAAAAALLRKLLEPEPSKRLEHFERFNTPMEAVLEEPFFQGQSVDEATLGKIRAEQQKQTAMLTAIDSRTKEINDRTITMVHLQRATIQLLNEHASSLRACIQAGADDKVPTAFVILVKAPEPNFIEGVKNELAEIKDAGTAAAKGRSATEYVSCVEKMTAMYIKANGLVSKISGAISDPETFLKDQLKLHTVDTLELCLVCEVCWRPQRDGAYNVTTQSDLCAKVIPVAKATLYTIKAVNGLAGIAQCFFPGVPTVSKKFLERGSSLLEELDAPSSVAEFDSVQATLESETKDTDARKMEGGCLREFTRFLEKEDPLHKWADLQRALLTEGQSVWCCKDCIGIIKEDTNATYEEIRVKVEAAAEPLPEVTGDAASQVLEARAEAAEAAVVKAVARAEAAEANAKASGCHCLIA